MPRHCRENRAEEDAASLMSSLQEVRVGGILEEVVRLFLTFSLVLPKASGLFPQHSHLSGGLFSPSGVQASDSQGHLFLSEHSQPILNAKDSSG